MTAVDTDLSTLEEFLAEEIRLTHIVAPSDNPDICHMLGNGPEIGSVDIVAYARLHLMMVTALCGYRFIPVNNPEKYPACESCVEEARKRINE